MTKKTKNLKHFALSAAIALTGLSASANVLLSDNFAYNVGDLYNQGGWVLNGKNIEAPIQVVAGSLTLPGYQDTPVGNMAAIGGNNNAKDQILQKQFSEDAIVSGKIYYSALIKATEVGSGKSFVLSLSGKNFSGWGDGISNGRYNSLAVTASSEGKFKVGLAAATATATYGTTEYDLNKTYLVVVGYDFATKDISLWVNPTSATATPEVLLAGKGSVSTTNGVQGVAISPVSSAANPASHVDIDAVRVATDLADLLCTGEGGGDEPGPNPPAGDASISASVSTLDFGATLPGNAVTKDFTISATGLTGDVNVSVSAPFSVSATSIPKDEADGYTLSVTYKPTKGGEYKQNLTISSPGAENVTVALTGSALNVTTPLNYANISNNLLDNSYADGEVLSIESRNGVVTFVDGKKVYLQDFTGAICVDFQYVDGGVNLKRADKVSQIYAQVIEGALYAILPVDSSNITAGTDKTPTPVTIAELKASPDLYWNRLVQIEDLTFTETGDFASKSYDAVDSSAAIIMVHPFAGTDLIGTPIPAKATVSGIAVAKNGAVIWPRDLGDITDAQEANQVLQVTPEQVFTGEAAKINERTKYATFDVKTLGLTAPVSVYLTGKNRDMFELDADEIPVGQEHKVITLYYVPTEIGKHDVRVNFEAQPTDLSTGYSITAYAYDPNNLPDIIVPESMPPFSAAPGTTSEQTFKLSSANLIDYGTMTISSSVPGSFILASSSFLKNTEQDIKVTFRPAQAGEYTATITFTSRMAEPKTLTITGTSTGTVEPEKPEGQPLVYDTSNPLKEMTQNFDGVADYRNKAFTLPGWVNAAVEGTRAWWGYSLESDGQTNYMAKVTAFDSKATKSSPMEAMLLTPALDFRNAESKLFTFSVMATLLPESGDPYSTLDVCYIDLLDGPDQPYIQPITGLDIPMVADQNEKWIDHVINLDGLDLADVFFIGFRFKSTRGTQTATSYYIDNVSWGRTDIPYIYVDTDLIDIISEVGQTATSEEVTVTGANLSSPIEATIVGANASKFKPTVKSLPAEGGKIAVTFSPEEIGLHEAYLQLSSEGAPTMLIPIAGHATPMSAIDNAGEVTDDATVTVYSLQGVLLLDAAPRSALSKLPAGLYIVNGEKVVL